MPHLKDNDILRKYMSLSKLIFLLQNKKLYFSRADLVKCYKESSFRRHNNRYEFFYGNKESIAAQTSLMKINPLFLINTDEIAKYIFVYSWNQGDSESNALWQTFKLKDETIVLETNFSKFKQSIDQNIELLTEKVKYSTFRNYRTRIVNTVNYYSPFFIQDISYSYQNEARILFSTFDNSIPTTNIEPIKNEKEDIIGLYIPIDISVLIENIIVFPDALDFEFEAIKSLVNKLAPECNVIRSSLDKRQGQIKI